MAEDVEKKEQSIIEDMIEVEGEQPSMTPEVPTPSPSQEPPSSPPPERKKLSKSFRKKLVVGGLVVLVALGVLGGFWLYNYTSTRVSHVAVSHTETDSGIVIGIHLSTTGKDYRGPVNIKISYLYGGEWEEVYSNSEHLTHNDGTHIVPYTHFVIGNGRYMVNATVNGITGSEEYEVKYIVENLTVISASPDDPHGGSTFTAKVQLLSENGTNPDLIVNKINSSLMLSVYREENDISTLVSSQTISPLNSLEMEVTFDYPSSGKTSGWYRFEAELTNHKTKSSSPLYTVFSTSRFYLNRNPNAVVSYTPEGDVDPGDTLTFDASASTDPDNDNIVNYSFAVSRGDTILAEQSGPSSIFTYTFPTVGTYIISVTVIDDAGLDLYDSEGNPGQDGMKESYIGLDTIDITIVVDIT